MTTRIDADVVTADHGLESRHRALWALGDYTTVATELVSPLGEVLVQASRIGPGDRVLDVAAGAGNAAIPAALAGAEVTASDLVPELLSAGPRSLRPGVSICNGVKPMPKHCRSTAVSSTRCSPASG
jgi:2-polyprenyl-3-methyl-5-hydroxy-6-metoxy-1,4-benzoquinol methylase